MGNASGIRAVGEQDGARSMRLNSYKLLPAIEQTQPGPIYVPDSVVTLGPSTQQDCQTTASQNSSDMPRQGVGPRTQQDCQTTASQNSSDMPRQGVGPRTQQDGQTAARQNVCDVTRQSVDGRSSMSSHDGSRRPPAQEVETDRARRDGSSKDFQQQPTEQDCQTTDILGLSHVTRQAWTSSTNRLDGSPGPQHHTEQAVGEQDGARNMRLNSYKLLPAIEQTQPGPIYVPDSVVTLEIMEKEHILIYRGISPSLQQEDVKIHIEVHLKGGNGFVHRIDMNRNAKQATVYFTDVEKAKRLLGEDHNSLARTAKYQFSRPLSRCSTSRLRQDAIPQRVQSAKADLQYGTPVNDPLLPLHHIAQNPHSASRYRMSSSEEFPVYAPTGRPSPLTSDVHRPRVQDLGLEQHGSHEEPENEKLLAKSSKEFNVEENVSDQQQCFQSSLNEKDVNDESLNDGKRLKDTLTNDVTPEMSQLEEEMHTPSGQSSQESENISEEADTEGASTNQPPTSTIPTTTEGASTNQPPTSTIPTTTEGASTNQTPTSTVPTTTKGDSTDQPPTSTVPAATEDTSTNQAPTSTVPTTIEATSTDQPSTSTVPSTIEAISTNQPPTSTVPTTIEATSTDQPPTSTVPAATEDTSTKQAPTSTVPTTIEATSTNQPPTSTVPTTIEATSTDQPQTSTVPTATEATSTDQTPISTVPTTIEATSTNQPPTSTVPTTIEATSTNQPPISTVPTATEATSTDQTPISTVPTTIEATSTNQPPTSTVPTTIEATSTNQPPICTVPIATEAAPAKRFSIETEVEEATQPCYSIDVRGFNPDTSNDTIGYYFENTRRSGGGAIYALQREGNVIHITFASNDVNIVRILEKEHKIDDATLHVQRVETKALSNVSCLITNVKVTTTKEILTYFLEAKSGTEIQTLMYSQTPGKALATFQSKPDFEKLSRACEIGLEGNILSIERVKVCDTIILRGMNPNTTQDTIKYYFENKKSGNTMDAEVVVTMDRVEKYATVQFSKHKVVESVRQKEHLLDESRLVVSMYTDGFSVGEFETESSWYQHPEPFTMDTLNKRKCAFLRTRKGSDMLQTELEKVHAEVTWSRSSAKLNCTLTPDTENSVLLVRAWAADVKRCMENILDSVNIEVIRPLQEIWDDVRKSLTAAKLQDEEEVILDVSDAKLEFVIIGCGQAFTRIVDVVKSHVKGVETDYEKKKQDITEKLSTLKPGYTRLLAMSGFLQRLHQLYPDVHIYEEGNGIILKGQVSDVRKCSCDIYEYVNTFHSTTVDYIPDDKLNFLNQEDITKIVNERLTADGLLAEWKISMESRTLTVVARTEYDTAIVLSVLEDAGITRQYSLDLEKALLLESEKWMLFARKLKEQYEYRFAIYWNMNDRWVSFIATKDIYQGILDDTQAFLSSNAVYRKDVYLPTQVFRFFQEHSVTLRRNIDKHLRKHYDGGIDYPETEQRIIVFGQTAGINEAIQKITDFANNMISREYTLKKSGVRLYMMSEKGARAIEHTEKKERCIILDPYDASDTVQIEICMQGQSLRSAIPLTDIPLSDTPRSIMPRSNTPRSDHEVSGNNALLPADITQCASCTVDSQRQIYVIMGDLTRLKVDVIVNAANDRLDHCGGLALAIANQGGPSIQKESNAYIAKHKKVSAGNAMTTGPGRLPCKMVVHAVGPIYKGGNQGEEAALKKAVLSTLDLAADRGYTSIAVPALSAGIYNYPAVTSTRHIVEAIRDYYNRPGRQSPLENIYLVDISRACVDQFILALKAVYNDRQVTITSRGTNTPAVPVATPRQTRNDRTSRQDHAPDTSIAPGNTRFSVDVITGDIGKQQAHVIINTTSKELNLSKGAVSKSVLKNAGPAIQKDLNDLYPNGIEHGQIAVSSNGKLKCFQVYHITLPSWSDDNACITTLQQITEKCLQQVSDSGYTSLVFPALGTGNLGYPPDQAARAMLASIYGFQQRDTSLEEVRIVIYHTDKDVLRAFQQYQTEESTHRAPSTEQQNRHPTDTPGLPSPLVVLRKGDISTQKADVIVNTTSRDLDLDTGAVSKAILKAAGVGVQTEVKQNYPQGITGGQIAESSGGALRCQKLYHICLPVWSSDDNGRKNLETIVKGCLQKASDARFKSIAFPALGTGRLNYPRDVVAQTLYHTINTLQGTASLQEVTIVVHVDDKASIKAFEKCGGQTQVADTRLRSVGSVAESGGGSGQIQPSTEHNRTGVEDVHIGRVTVLVKQGDITKENADCIVNSTNLQLDINRGAVSKAIATACGADMESQCRQKVADMKQRGIVTTTASGLSCKYVLHVAGEHFANNWSEVISACLEEADSHGDIHSLAFPALGTGIGNVSPKALASIMLQALSQFEATARNLQDIRIVIFQEAMLKPFQSQFLGSTDTADGPAEGCAFMETLPHGHVNLYFYSDNNANIDRAIQLLKDKCDEDLKTEKLQNPEIRNLGKEIKQIGRKYDVHIDVSSAIGTVTITGLALPVAKTSAEIENLLHSIRQRKGERERNKLLARSIKWKFILDTVSRDFTDAANAEIEKAYEKKKKNHIAVYTGGKMKIDFDSMLGHNVNDNSEKFNVIRRDVIAEAIPFERPHHWTEDESVHELSNGSIEYNKVAAKLNPNTQKLNIIKIERVQNLALYRQYQAKKQAMEEQNPGMSREQDLWHGTSVAATSHINKHGFNRSFCGKNATAYGQGVYFAVDAGYSLNDTYSVPDANRNKYVYLANVLTGSYTQGRHGMRTPPSKTGDTSSNDLFDTVVDNVNSPTMYVVFNDPQVYPEYLITVKR